jgi:trypsin
MKLASLTVALGAMLALLPSSNVLAQTPPAPSVKPFIVGGQPENDIQKLHWQVALILGDDSNRDQFCGGTLIAPDWVLTAAHCVDSFMVQKNPKNVDVVAGTVRYDKDGERSDVEKIFVHPNWNNVQFDFDAALLKLKTPIRSVKPIAFMAPTGTIADGTPLRVSGWGAVAESAPGSTQLLFVDVPVVNTAECNKPESYGGRITAQMFCAGLRDGGKDSCQGDSGGPLVSGLSPTGPELIGIVSWGEGCARRLKYGIYTRVNTVSQWVTDTMKGN